MTILEKTIYALSKKTSQFAQLALVLVMLVIVSNILLRIWWRPLPGSYELVEILGAVILSMGIAYCAVTRGHVTVSLIVDKLSIRNQAFVDLITSTISLIFISSICWGLIQYGNMVQSRGLETSTLAIPLYPVYYLMAAGFAMLSLTALLDVIKSLSTLFKKRKKY